MKLKPCPFCGNIDKVSLEDKFIKLNRVIHHYRVSCRNCWGREYAGTEKLAIKMWNRRPRLKKIKE